MKGWTLPQTSTGRSALVAPPPWHYSGEIIAAEITADPAAIAGLMPEGFEPHPQGAGAVVFADWSSSSDADVRLIAEPAVGQYKEAFVLLYATWQGRPVARVPYIWVDNDVSLVRGLIQGFPKKLGAIAMTRPVELGRGGPRKQPGGRFFAHTSANGERRLSVSVTIDAEGGVLPPYLAMPMVHTRLWPSIASASPAVEEHQESIVEGSELGSILWGAATVDLGESAFDELHELGPVSVARGFVHSLAFSVTGGRSTPIQVRGR